MCLSPLQHGPGFSQSETERTFAEMSCGWPGGWTWEVLGTWRLLPFTPHGC